jgi:hypothetical protein
MSDKKVIKGKTQMHEKVKCTGKYGISLFATKCFRLDGWTFSVFREMSRTSFTACRAKIVKAFLKATFFPAIKICSRARCKKMHSEDVLENQFV